MKPLTPADIRYNLRILAGQKSYPGKGRLKADDINETTLEFIEIFGEQIESFKRSPEYGKLNQLVQRVASRIYGILESRGVSLLTDHHIPLIGKKSIPVSDLAKTYSKGRVKGGLESLPLTTSVRRIRGDGHCLFRSLSWGLTLRYKRLGMEGKFQQLKHTFPDLENTIEEMLSILSNKRKDSRSSNTLVHGLRQLACAYISSHREDFEGHTSTDLDRYLADMADMTKKKHGGELELKALSEMLGIEISVFDALNARECEYQPQSPITDDKIHLLLRPGHYDYLEN